MLDLARAYADTQRSLAEFVRSLPEEQLQQNVPASPDWSVQDVVAHVAGLAGDVAYDRAPPELDVVRSLTDSAQAELRDTMTEKQVASRRGRSLEEILDDPYLKNRSTEEQRLRLLERPEVIRAVGEDTAAMAAERVRES